MEQAIILQSHDLKKIIRDAIRTELDILSRSTPQATEQQEGDIDFALDVLKVFSKSTIYKLTSEGRIPYRKRGRTLWFNRIDLEKWLSEGATAQRDTAL